MDLVLRSTFATPRIVLYAFLSGFALVMGVWAGYWLIWWVLVLTDR